MRPHRPFQPILLPSPSSFSRRLALGFLAFALLDAARADLPKVDFDRMGKVGLGGAFAGLDLFDNSSSVSFDSATSSLLSRSSNGSLTSLGSTNEGGSILAGCMLGDTFYFGGSFTSVDDGVSASNVASYTPSSNSFASLGSGGPNGEVSAIYCDSKDNKVWVGGSFSSPGQSVAVWDAGSSSWSAPPFGGLSGAAAKVLSITTNASDSSLFFAGSFLTSFQGNGSALNDTNNPNVPYSPGATPFSSSLVPVPLGNAEVEGSPSSSDPSFNNIQNILCPAGDDGPGNTWLAADGNSAQITVRTYSYLNARGIRLGNTFFDGRGTTGFTVTTLPDNTVQTLQYLDSTTGQNTTCTEPCPLSTDPSIPYQDFLYTTNQNNTGVQITLTEWQGAGPGLHLLQLLSSGAFASAASTANGQSCFAPEASDASMTGSWVEKDAATGIAGTQQTVLTSDVAIGTSPDAGPSFTWRPYVSASGAYSVYMLVPGCTAFQDCAARTSVKVTLFPGGGQNPWVQTVDQTNTDDAEVLLYSGPVVPSSDDFVITVTMTLADNPTGSGDNGQYEIVADRIELVLDSADTGSSGSSSGGSGGGSGSSGSGSTKTGFGFFEWPLSDSSDVTATSTLANSTETAFDAIGFDLLTGLGGTSNVQGSTTNAIAAVAHHSSGTIFLAGNFSLSSGASYIVAYKNGALTALNDNGLNGPVTSLVLDGDNLFVGGTFTDTASNSMSGTLSGVAEYDVQGDRWSALSAGVNGGVTSLSASDNQLQVVGNFTEASGLESSGLAVWDMQTSSWTNSGGFLVGSMTFVGNGTDDSQFVAGNVAASLKYGASGFVMLQNGDNGEAQVTPLSVSLEGNTSASSSSTSSNSVRRGRRSHLKRKVKSWLHVPRLFSRQSSGNSLAALPSPPPAPAPAVLAGAFWTNSSSNEEVTIIGGNFSFSNSSASTDTRGVAIYDSSSGLLTPLPGAQVNGTVRTLLVQGDTLYVGGEFGLEGANVDGFAIYDLAQQSWSVDSLPTLQASSASSVSVRSISASSSKANAIIVAGTFNSAGGLPCKGICSWDTSSTQWTALGNGIQGAVASVSYAGSNQETLVAAGSIALSDSTAANVASFTFSNSSWAPIGDASDLPGPVTAVTVNDGNASSIFAAGRSSDGSSPFLSFWNGASWASIGDSLEASTNVTQLAMVPLQDTHSANGIIESDRMLLISGDLSDSSFGTASSALFDGQSFTPYIMSTSATGTSGSVFSLFWSYSSFSFTQRHYLAVGIVILISIAIAAGVVFLLVLIGILWTLFARKNDDSAKFDAADDDDDSNLHRPSSLLAHINAATRTTIIGTSPYSNYADKEEENAGGMQRSQSPTDHDLYGPDESNFVRAETPSEAIALGSDEMVRSAHARYSFDGTGEGELPLAAGQELEILDDRDESWWYARDVRTGQEGVVPASYLY